MLVVAFKSLKKTYSTNEVNDFNLSETVTKQRLSPIYTAENFWHGSDEKSTRTKKIGSARIDLVV